MAYNATKLHATVKKRDAAQNWLVYFQVKHSRTPSTRPTTKVNTYAFCWILFNYLFCRPLSALLLRCLLVTGENQSQINFSLKCWMRINLAFWSVAHCEPTSWLIFPVTSGNMREILSTSVHIVVCQLNLVVSCGHPTNTIWWQWSSGLIRPMQQFWAK